MNPVEALYRRRSSPSWRARLRRALQPPDPFILNPSEPKNFPLGRWNLYIGGGGSVVPGYVNLDLFPIYGVDVAADAELLPFPDATFARVECDAVLEHVQNPDQVMREIRRVSALGAYVHLVTPFCHPFHEYPKDYRRFTIDGLKQMASGFEVVAEGWRTGPTATLLVFTLEYAKGLMPWQWARAVVHGVLGWSLFPLRYLDLLLLKKPLRIGNHCYIWLRRC